MWVDVLDILDILDVLDVLDVLDILDVLALLRVGLDSVYSAGDITTSNILPASTNLRSVLCTLSAVMALTALR